MTRLSGYLLPTLKEAPADAEATSHKLMVRAGLIRQLGAGMWTYLPAGWRVQHKIEQIIRDEMDAIGAQEMLMPVLQPAELWQKTGRYGIPEIFKLSDRNERPLLLAMTHEENVTYHVAREVSSYRDLPLILYHIQTKERDEPRPRAGVLRTREFIMKDSYSFDRDEGALEHSYQLHIQAYNRIFARCGLEWYRVESDVGMMGGLGAHEYMAPCAAGENEVVLCACGYAANIEVAQARPDKAGGTQASDEPQLVETPDARKVEEVASRMGLPRSAFAKALPMVRTSGGVVLVLVRGDRRLNEVKLRSIVGEPMRPAHPEEIEKTFGTEPGFIGPVSINTEVEVIADIELQDMSLVTGANRPGFHLRGVKPGRDFAAAFHDVRSVEGGDSCLKCGEPLRVEAAIEVGNIFKLGTRYSEPLNATYLDENGKEQPIVMGSYGIGPARIAAAAVEQRADEHGIVWPKAISPFEVHLVTIGKPGSEQEEIAEGIYKEALGQGMEMLFDDRAVSPGQKFADAELLGCPLRLTVGKRTVESKEVEIQIRDGRRNDKLALDQTVARSATLLAEIE